MGFPICGSWVEDGFEKEIGINSLRKQSVHQCPHFPLVPLSGTFHICQGPWKLLQLPVQSLHLGKCSHACCAHQNPALQLMTVTE